MTVQVGRSRSRSADRYGTIDLGDPNETTSPMMAVDTNEEQEGSSIKHVRNPLDSFPGDRFKFQDAVEVRPNYQRASPS